MGAELRHLPRHGLLIGLLLVLSACANSGQRTTASSDEAWRSLVGSWHTTTGTKSLILSIHDDGTALMMFIESGSFSINRVPWQPFHGGILLQGIPRIRLWHGRYDEDLRAEIEPIPQLDYDPDQQFMRRFFMSRVTDRSLPEGWRERPVPPAWVQPQLDPSWDPAAGKRGVQPKP